MDDITWMSIQEKMLQYLTVTFQLRPDGQGGWGRVRGQPISIVNTVEALLTLKEIDALENYLNGERGSAIRYFLQTLVAESVEQKIAVTRYLAYGAIGLGLIGELAVCRREPEKDLITAKMV